MGKKSAKRHALFDTGARAIARISGKPNDRYACPLCKRLFDRCALTSGLLTLEHVPPAALGGKGIALTCKSCNSSAGHRLDAEAKARDSLRDLSDAMFRRQGSYRGKAQLTIDGVTLNAEIRAGPKGTEIVVDERRNRPRAFREQHQRLKDSVRQGGLPMNLGVGRFHIWRSQVADLRSAYLVAFAALGYRYALNPALDLVREQIARPQDKLLQNICLINGGRREPPLLTEMREPFAALAVRLGLTTALLPWDRPAQDFYPKIGQYFNEARAIHFKAIELEWPRSLVMTFDFA